ncbi:MAG: hypothetical protein ABL928_03080 [Sphingorhabdus sp.]
MGKKKETPPNFDFLLEADVQLENRVRPTEEARGRFKMADDNHRHVSGKSVLDVFWSNDFRRNLPSKVDQLDPC